MFHLCYPVYVSYPLAGPATDLLTLHTTIASPPLQPWNKVARDHITAQRMGSSESTRLLAQLHVAQVRVDSTRLVPPIESADDPAP